MPFGDNLSVRVSANTNSFERGISDAQDSLSKFQTSSVATAGSLQFLQGRADEAGDEISSVGTKATTSSLSLAQLSAATGAANISFQGLETTLIVGLIPTLALLSTALVPVTAALGGLAAIVGSIGLVAFAGVLGAIKTNTQQLKQEAQDLVATLKAEFAPFFDTFSAALVTLTDRLQGTISELAPTQEQSESLANSLVQIGTAVIDVLPALSDLALSLSDEFAPTLVTLAEDVLPDLPGFITGLVSTFRQLSPQLRGAGTFVLRLTQGLFDLGMTVITVITPAFRRLGRATNGLISGFNGLSANLKSLGVSVGLLIGPLGVLVSLLGGPITVAIVGLAAAIAGLGKAFRTNFAGIRDSLSQFGNQAKTVLPAAKSAFNAFLSAVDIASISNSLRTFESILGTELKQSVTALKPVFGDLKTLLIENKEEFRVIGGAIGSVVNGLIKIGQAFAQVLGPAFRQVGIPLIRGFITVIDGAITQISNLIRLFNALKSGNVSEALDITSDIGQTAIDTTADLVPAQQTNQTPQQQNQEIRVKIEEDTENVTATARSEAENVVTERERRAKRGTGGITNP